MNRDEHLFIKLMEECAEVQQRTSKLLQFGPNETESGMLFNNSQRLRAELDDLQGVIALLEEEFLIPHTSPESASIYLKHKREKIAKYRAYSEKLGLVAGSAAIPPALPKVEDFDAWWERDGKFFDPDTDDVPWFDKRKFLAEYAWHRAKGK